MKHGWNIFISLVIVSMAALTACSKSSGGGGGSTASTPTGTVGAAGYVGDGNWSTRLQITNMPQYQQMSYELGLCTTQDCGYLAPSADLVLSLQNGGCLPGPGNFSLQSYYQGYYPGHTISRRGDASVNGSSNGFLISYTNPYSQASYSGQSQASGTLQINTTFTDTTHNALSVQILYNGQQVAAGTAYGQAQYNAQASAQSAAYCSQGYGNGYGGGAYGGGNYYGGGNGGNYYGGNYYGGNNGGNYYGSGYSAGGYIYYQPFSKRK